LSGADPLVRGDALVDPYPTNPIFQSIRGYYTSVSVCQLRTRSMGQDGILCVGWQPPPF